MVDLLLSFVPGEWLVGGIFAIIGVLFVWVTGRSAGAKNERNKMDRQYKKTRKRMDNEDNDIHGDDPASARRFLSERGEQ